MRIVVTGASGNVGSAVLRRLASDDTHELVGVARRLPDGSGPPFDRASWSSIDLTGPTAAGALTEVVRGADAVVHLAWGFQPSHDLAHLEELGVGGTRRVIEAVEAAGVRHLVHMSSVGAYSPREHDDPVDESWPTGGVPSSPYSRHKSAAEGLLDSYEAGGGRAVVTRLRPGIVGQAGAASALLRYGLPAVVPSRAVGWLPLLPVDRRLEVPVVHADDVAEAVQRVLAASAPGAFNLATEPPMTPPLLGDVLGARPVHLPAAVLRAGASAAWHARLQPVDPGWVDLAFAVPLLDTGRARGELGWSPTRTAHDVLEEVVGAMRTARSDDTPALRPRQVPAQLLRALRRGPVTSRREP